MFQSDAHASSRANRQRVFLGVVLVAATLLLYFPVRHFQFLTDLDDNVYITQNAHVQTGFTTANLKWALTTSEPFYWHPVTWFSHMLDCTLFGVNAGPHHLGNALLHAANVLLLFLLLERATGALWRSGFASLLFAVHPLNIETVAWAAERKTLLSTLFILLATAAYGRYLQRPNWRRYGTIGVLFLLALMSKPLAVTFPLMLLLIDFWPLNRLPELPPAQRWGRLLIEKVPLFAMSAAVAALAVFGEKHADAAVPFSILPLSTRLQNVPLSYVSYLAKLLWPVRLSAFYPHPAMKFGPVLPAGEVLACSFILITITGLFIYFRRAQFALMGWLFFLINLVPLIGIVQLGYQGIQAHFVYIPCIGIFIALAWSMGLIANNGDVPRAAAVLLSFCFVAGLTVATVRYLPNWEDSVKLFGHSLSASAEPNPWLEQLYGNALYSAHRNDEALEHFQRSCALGPRNEHCHYYSALILFERGQYPAALQECQNTLMLTRNGGMALNCLARSGDALLQLRQYDAARSVLMQASRIDPNNPDVLRLANALNTR